MCYNNGNIYGSTVLRYRLNTLRSYMKQKKQNAFTVFFSQFPRLMLAGLLFSAPMAIFMGLSVLLAKLSGFDNVLVWGLGVIPASVFLPGLVMVVRKYAVEKSFVTVVPAFFSAVRENARDFLLHGAVTYLILTSSFFALLYYFTQAQSDIVFAYVLVIYILFTAVMLCMMFYVPLMSVTYELRYRDIYKNSLLMIFGKIFVNLLTFIITGVLVGGAVLLLVYTDGVWRWVTLGLLALFMPLLICYIIVSMISKGLQENVGSFTPAEPPKAELSEEEAQTLGEVASEEDYIFINGKMVKNPHK